MNGNGRQPLRSLDLPFDIGLPLINNRLVPFSTNSNNTNCIPAAGVSNLRKRKSEEIDNPDFRPKSADISRVPNTENRRPLMYATLGHLIPPTQTLQPNPIANMPAHLTYGSVSQSPIVNGAPQLLYDTTFWQRYDFMNPQALNADSNRPALTVQKLLLSPLPLVDWADRVELWENMLRKDIAYVRSPTCLARHKTLQPRMRSILLSWMTEVSEVYSLRRETYYLAVDFLDRFLATSKKEVLKNDLQLVGITTLFIAAKIEEIYPPKIKDFAYVTDGAYFVEEIKRMELIILGTLDWQLCPLTPVGWLSTFLQIAYLSDVCDRELKSIEIALPKYSRDFFTSIAQILDLCSLDIESLRFPYSHLAAAALFHMSNENIVKTATGISIQALQPCIEWMRTYVDGLFERGFAEQHLFDGICREEQHTIQQHCVGFEMLETIQKKAAERRKSQGSQQREQRFLFVDNVNQGNRNSFAESPLRSNDQSQLLPLTPMSTPPEINPVSNKTPTTSYSTSDLYRIIAANVADGCFYNNQ